MIVIVIKYWIIVIVINNYLGKLIIHIIMRVLKSGPDDPTQQREV